MSHSTQTRPNSGITTGANTYSKPRLTVGTLTWALALVGTLAGALGPAVPPVYAGGFLETFDFTGAPPGPFPNTVLLRLVPIRWDLRCIPVRYSVNTTLDPIPNPLGADFLSLADATAAMQRGFDAWNDISTSYIDMQITGTTDNPGIAGFDMVNELTFRTPPGFGAFASSPSTAIQVDAFLFDGEDLDGDGDVDIRADLTVCEDADGDGDIEFPEGFYEAGTIFDNDVQYASETLRFTVADEDLDLNFRSVDLEALAVHENGHSHGLSHAVITQTSDQDGNMPSMTPGGDTDDPPSELARRVPHPDDVAWSSLHYPEGTASTGLPALQPGDVAFSEAYGLIEGEVRHGVLDEPVAGAHVFAVDRATGRTVAGGYSGTARFGFDFATGFLFLTDAATNIVDGRYRLPVRPGLYDVWIEAVDGQPLSASSITFSTVVGAALGQLDFTEEAFHQGRESAVELHPGSSTPVLIEAGGVTPGIDLVTNRTQSLGSFGALDFFGFAFAPPGTWLASEIPIEPLLGAFGGKGFLLQSVDFLTFHFDRSEVPRFAEIVLTSGRVLPDGTARLDLDSPLERATDFVGQDFDFAPWLFPDAQGLAERIQQGVANGQIERLFVALRLPSETPFPGSHGFPPVIGVDFGDAVPNNDAPTFGLSYASLDGEVFLRDIFNYMVRVTVSPVP